MSKSGYLKSVQGFFKTGFAQLALSQHCFLCHSLNADIICPDCLQDLPRIGNACPRCAQALPVHLTGAEHCPFCQKQKLGFDTAQAAFQYAYPVNKLILAGKYHYRLELLRYLGTFMAQQLPLDELPDVLLPVPSPLSMLRRRGYNQAVELARWIQKRYPLPIDTRHVSCHNKKHAQAELTTYQERQRNVRGIFQVQPLPAHWRHVWIIDDVMTTGATASELAKTVRHAGAEKVTVWCCARNQRF
ncbi:ComF family protein [Candidatus Venteria ishoeyi]|uniref:ComF family protein n=1 Tax=Candidatus Venteria ishoeyi TaxID=1899563 RepID=UPI0025A59374|nr:ComF family protein [Candidatus Venteria ishoeyi]MDM8546757.1 ComF family protein [Candidatus Venteria ishoeyi]